jgi:hypothetical protein
MFILFTSYPCPAVVEHVILCQLLFELLEGKRLANVPPGPRRMVLHPYVSEQCGLPE